jgi:ABC-type branched-subunit amino acid transport system substrate-binding protein
MNNTVLLLELTGNGLILQDRAILRTFKDIKENEYFRNKGLENIEIYDTNSKIETTISLLNDLYNRGKRIFIGFNRSTILTGVIEWFESHEDTYGISITSTSPTLNIKKNIYRMIPPDNKIIETYLLYLNNYKKIICSWLHIISR